MDPLVDRVLVDARARSIEVRDQIAATAYCVTHAVGDALVMRIPRSEFTNAGPFLTDASRPDCAVLLDSSTDRHRHLPSFVDRLELAGVPVALHARAIGRAPRREDIGAIARALATLHETVPWHGHLTPSHIVVGDEIAFTDLLPDHPNLLGGVGYALPIHGDPALRDVVALASIAAELDGIQLGWSREFAKLLELINRGMSRPWDPQPALDQLYQRTENGWICAVGRLAIDHYVPLASMRPKTTRPREPVPGTARSLLADHDKHAALGALARSLTRSPSLFDFLVHERAAPIESSEPRPDPAQAVNASEASFEAIMHALPALHAIYANAPISDLAPLAHHSDVAEELRPLRTLLVDLDRLLAPTPGTPVGALLARVRENIDRIHEAPYLMPGRVRRYVNYISNMYRVY
jgi:hypothetical protein